MHVHLSFDIEIWCNGWQDLDARFPAAFERYVYGRSAQGEYALPKTLEILNRHGLRGVFFVEPLFSARFGERYLDEVVGLIDRAGQDVQLHLHPEWTDEIRPPLIADVSRKRQHLLHYTLEEQTALVRWGKEALEKSLGRSVQAFRAGSYAANANTYRALELNGLRVDSSLNRQIELSGPDLEPPKGSFKRIGGLQSFPITCFRDGLGKLRPAQVGACSFAEMRDALTSAHAAGCEHFVIVSHNFEMLYPGRSERDSVVARRFERLCEFLAAHPSRFEVGAFPVDGPAEALATQLPRAGLLSTAQRHLEQVWRRLQ